MKSIFAMFSLASKELFRYNVNDSSATNMVSALTALREKLIFIQLRLFPDQIATLQTIQTENGALDVIQINQSIACQFIEHNTFCSKKLIKLNYNTIASIVSEKFQQVLQASQGADLLESFAPCSVFQFKHNLIDLFIDVSNYSKECSGMIQQFCKDSVILAIVVDNKQLLGMQTQQNINLNNFKQEKQQLSFEINSIIDTQLNKICIPSIQPNALLFIQRKINLITISAKESEIEQFIPYKIVDYFGYTYPDVTDMLMFNVSLFQVKKCTLQQKQHNQHKFEQVIYNKYKEDDFFDTTKSQSWSKLDEFYLFEYKEVVLVVETQQVQDETSLVSRCWQIIRAAMWAEM